LQGLLPPSDNSFAVNSNSSNNSNNNNNNNNNKFSVRWPDDDQKIKQHFVFKIKKTSKKKYHCPV
jgi:hypothetical protein